MASGRLSILHQVVCEVHGKVKKTDISLPTRDFKNGKMLVYRLGNSSSFSIGIQTENRPPLSTIDLKSHQFEVHTRPKRMTIIFKNSNARLSIVEADEEELKKLVEMLESLNYNTQDKKIRMRQNMSTLLIHQEVHSNDENQPNNICTENSQTPSSNEVNQFLSSSPTTQIKIKRKHTPFASGAASSFYGSRNTGSPVKRLALSPKIDISSVSSSNTKESTPKTTDSRSSPLERKKIVGLSKDFRRKPTLSRFLFKPSSKPSFTDDLQLTGFSNLGNTCYMNAILQSLLGIQPFVQDLCKKSLLVKHPAQSLYKCTHGLLVCKKKNCPQDLQSLHLRKFKRAISQAATRFSGHLQHDAHEFLCQVLDQLKDEVAALSNKESTDSSPNCTVKEEYFTQSCPVTRTFECAVSHTITCKGCGENVTKEEILHDLSLDLPSISDESTFHSMKGIPIDKLIEDYFKDEELEYCCEECGFKEASISHKFSKLPRVLILHVKRYDFNKLTDKHAKKHNLINIKKFIDIGRLCTDKTSPPLQFEVQNVKSIDVKTPVAHMPEALGSKNTSTSTTPSARRQLNQEFNTTPMRKRKVLSVESDDENNSTQHEMKENVQVTVKNLDSNSGSQRNVQITTNPADSIIEDFEDIDKTPLHIESTENTIELLSMPEDEQLEWALRESLKTKSERKDQSESDEDCEYDMDCTDEEIMSALTDNYCQQTVGLKGGAHKDSDENEQSDDSEQSGIVPSSKPVTVISDDSTETSANEDGHRKDSSLCSLIDQQPVLNEFDGDLLIEVDTNKRSAKMTDSSQRKNKFVKTVSSPFNAKFRPRLFSKTTQSAQKSSVRTPSPSTYSKSRLHMLSQSEQPKSRKSLYSESKESSDYEDDLAKAIQKSLEDQEVQSEDDEEMRRAIQLSIQETKMYAEDCLPMETFKNYESPEKLVPDSVDSGFQGDDGMSFPYRLVSVVSHLGSKSSAGHYISDVYDCSKDEWTSYDDLTAIKIDEYNVRYGHARDGYIFFYMYKNCVNTVQNGKPVAT